MPKKLKQSNTENNYVKNLTELFNELDNVESEWNKIGFSNETISRESMKLFAEKYGNKLFMLKLMELSQVDTDLFLKHYTAFAKIVYPTMKAEDSKQKNLQITIMGNDTPRVNVIPNPSRVDLPSFNFDDLESPLNN
jgi:hypothetical protein